MLAEIVTQNRLGFNAESGFNCNDVLLLNMRAKVNNRFAFYVNIHPAARVIIKWLIAGLDVFPQHLVIVGIAGLCNAYCCRFIKGKGKQFAFYHPKHTSFNHLSSSSLQALFDQHNRWYVSFRRFCRCKPLKAMTSGQPSNSRVQKTLFFRECCLHNGPHPPIR